MTHPIRNKDRKCNLSGCHEPVKSRGMCHKHYMAWHRYGDPLGSTTARKSGKPSEDKGRGRCHMPNCSGPIHGVGLCAMHYRRQQRYGDPWFDGRNYYECAIEGCYRKRVSRGYCPGHYDRWLLYGDPLGSAEGHTQTYGISLPVDPIVRMIADRTPTGWQTGHGEPGGMARLLDRRGLSEAQRKRVEKYLDRAIKRGTIDLAFADDFACKVLKTHPALIWGEDWWTADAEPEGATVTSLPRSEGDDEEVLAA